MDPAVAEYLERGGKIHVCPPAAVAPTTGPRLLPLDIAKAAKSAPAPKRWPLKPSTPGYNARARMARRSK
jgi:hypothetical protein